MQLREILTAFKGLTSVYDSIESFKRKWELVPAYREIKEVVTLFENNREKIANKYGEKIPPEKQREFIKDVEKMLDEDVKLKHILKFSKDEVEESKIKGSVLVSIIEFISD